MSTPVAGPVFAFHSIPTISVGSKKSPPADGGATTSFALSTHTVRHLKISCADAFTKQGAAAQKTPSHLYRLLAKEIKRIREELLDRGEATVPKGLAPLLDRLAEKSPAKEGLVGLLRVRDASDRDILQQLEHALGELASQIDRYDALQQWLQVPDERPSLLAEPRYDRIGSALSSEGRQELIADEMGRLLNETILPIAALLEPETYDYEGPAVYSANAALETGAIQSRFSDRPLRIAVVGCEYTGLAKEGGLAEAIEGMTRGYKERFPESTMRLIFPKYSSLPAGLEIEDLPDLTITTGDGEHVGVSRAIIDGVELLFLDHPAFTLDPDLPKIYGPDEATSKRRFATLAGAAADLLYQLKGDVDVVHLHDWQVAGVVLKFAKHYRREWLEGELPATVFTFHNNSRSAQGRNWVGPYNYNPVVQALQEQGLASRNINPFVEALNYADEATTVSCKFALEAQTPCLGEGVSWAVRTAARVGKLTGILNGSSPKHWNPTTDCQLGEWRDLTDPARPPLDLRFGARSEGIFESKKRAKKQLNAWIKLHMTREAIAGSPPPLLPVWAREEGVSAPKIDPSKPIITYVGRFDSYQKGLDELEPAIESALAHGGQVVVMGSVPDDEANRILDHLEARFKRDPVLFIRDDKTASGYYWQQGDRAVGRPGIGSVIRAASDFIIVPSRYEPCGLTDVEGRLFGSLVIASNTGGLADKTIPDRSKLQFNGYLFERGSSGAEGVGATVGKALSEWWERSPAEHSKLAYRLMSDAKQWSWTRAPYGLSAVEKYDEVYRHALSRVELRRDSILPPNFFDLNAFRRRIPVAAKVMEADPQAVAEEAYLQHYYETEAGSAELAALQLEVDQGMAGTLPHPFGRNVETSFYQRYGAHYEKGVGTRFTVHAPNAKSVDLLIYDNAESYAKQRTRGVVQTVPLVRRRGEEPWEATCLVRPGAYYRYLINGTTLKLDPFAQEQSVERSTQLGDDLDVPWSIVPSSTEYEWGDDAWLARRRNDYGKNKPATTFEVHPTTWMVGEGRPLNYRELALRLIDHCKMNHYTHVELMGILQHPFEGSMGYQVTGYFVPNSRCGTAEDFKALVDALHQEGIGVILDWVPAHFAGDKFGLAHFDGTALLEAPDVTSRGGEDWGTHFPDWRKKWVRDFYLSSATFWLQEMHIDGLRIDAVKAILGSEDETSARLFLQDLASVVHDFGSGISIIAEDLSGEAAINISLVQQGFGSDRKWGVGAKNMMVAGWSAMSIDESEASGEARYNLLLAAHSQDAAHANVVVLSHDDVAMISGIFQGRPEAYQLFLRMMTTLPGHKLHFMGVESAFERDWTELIGHTEKGGLATEVAAVPSLVGELNALYLREPALHDWDRSGHDLEWVVNEDPDFRLLAFRRYSKVDETMLICHNVSGVTPLTHRFPVREGEEPTIAYQSVEGATVVREGDEFVVTLPPFASLLIRHG